MKGLRSALSCLAREGVRAGKSISCLLSQKPYAPIHFVSRTFVSRVPRVGGGASPASEQPGSLPQESQEWVRVSRPVQSFA